MTEQRYGHLELLYEGAFFRTYAALEMSAQKRVWLKTSVSAHPGGTNRIRLRQECDVSAMFGNEGFPVFSFRGENEANDIAVAENVQEGQTLRRWMNSRHGKLKLESALACMIAIVRMLEHVHQRRLVYNQLAPEALWITPQTSRIFPLDYGLVRKTGSSFADVFSSHSEIRHFPYLSPELTGRLPSAVDGRSDFYSLGCIMYELLTGEPPFRANEPLEWLHAHLAREAAPPTRLNPQIPETLSAIVMKCLAKTADERYQSAYGLRLDLQECLAQVRSARRFSGFRPAKQDPPSDLWISSRLVGRDSELRRLREFIAQSERMPGQFMLVSGEPGIGKTRLVRELQREQAAEGRVFVYGKFDQYHRDLPLRPWMDVFDAFIRFVMAQDAEEFSAWRQKMLDVLGPHVDVLTSINPQLELILGRHPYQEMQSAVERQHRMEMAIVRLLRVFKEKGACAVIVLDDLQWADPASLKLLELIMKQTDLSHVSVIGISRTGHAANRSGWEEALQRLVGVSERVQHIRLDAISADDIAEWLGATFHCPPIKTRELAVYLHARTAGNPLFISEYLRLLHESGQLRFSSESGQWLWRMEQITDHEQTVKPSSFEQSHFSVVDLLVARLGRVSPDKMRMLSLASCAGNRLDIQMAAELTGETVDHIRRMADELEKTGLLLADPPAGYLFAHDRVRKAVYSSMAEQEKLDAHYRLGWYWLKKYDTDPAANGDLLFDIVTHLNRVKTLLTESERKRLAGLNLLAGNRAKETNAFDHSIVFYKEGIGLLSERAWTEDYRLIYDLKRGYLESLSLVGDSADTEELFRELIRHAADRTDRTRVYLMKILLASRHDRHEEAISLGLEALKDYGWNIPYQPGNARILREWLKVKCYEIIGKQRKLRSMAQASDKEREEVMDILFSLGPSCYVVNPELMAYLALISCRYSYQSGIFHNTGIGFAAYGFITAFQMGNIRGALKLGDIAWELAQQYGTIADKYYVSFLYGAFIHHWGNPPAESERLLTLSRDLSVQSGNLQFVVYAVSHLLSLRHVRGVSLDELGREIEQAFRLKDRINDPFYGEFLTLYRQWVRNLQGKTDNVYRFDDQSYAFREDEYREKLSDRRKMFDYLLCKTQALFLLGNREEALKTAEEAQKLIGDFYGYIAVPEHDFYYCLLLLMKIGDCSGKERKRLLGIVRGKRRRFGKWARFCPSHYEHKCLLIDAEMARLAGADARAAELYRRAIDAATEHDYLQHAAIAHELAARFYLQKHHRKAYERHLSAAYYGYLAWGATAKAHQMAHNAPWLAQRAAHTAQEMAAQSRLPTPDSLELSALWQASQALSGEMELEPLLRKLLSIVLHLSGAERVALLLAKDGRLSVAASGESDDQGLACQLLSWTPLADCSEAMQSVAGYVFRTREVYVADRGDGMGGPDPLYALTDTAKVRSVLCVPLIRQNELTGMIYLENDKSYGVFTAQRIEILKLLASHIAISIQNAIMYSQLKKENVELADTVSETAVSLEHSRREAAQALVEKAISDERNRIAGEIHDTIGHTLTSVLLQIEAGKRLIVNQDMEAALEKLDNSQRQVREGLQNLRKSLFMLRDGIDETKEFEAELESFIEKTMAYTGITIVYDIARGLRLNAAQKYVLYRALQEGITNGIRHGEAEYFHFSLSKHARFVEFCLRDNGRGAEHVSSGLGLAAMHDRVRELKGSLDIQTAPGAGWTLKIRLPLAE
jgi:predicted ATPase/signal transduction histidine kinase